MKNTKFLALVLAILLVVCAIPFTASAAAEVIIIDGERVALVNSFGKMNYEGTAYQTFKTFTDAFNALGTEGGKIVFTGKIALPDFKDIKGRKSITIQGIGTKAIGNLLDFSGTAEAPVSEVVLEGDLTINFATIRLAPGAFLYTNGYSLSTGDGFDTYSVEKYVASGSNIITYPDPPSIAVGEINTNAAIGLSAGTYETLAAGSVNGKTVNGNTLVTLGGGAATTVVGANVGNGTMNGNAKLVIGEGNITKLVAGSSGGTVNGNVSVEIGGGKIEEVVIGAEAGATINGNIVVALNGGTFGDAISVGAGTVTGKKILITGADTEVSLPQGAADVIVKISGGFCEPVFEGTTLTGYLFSDEYGIPATSININGTEVASENGIYQLADGTSNVTITSKVVVKVNKNANYVAGYEDGTFRPQNNMTRAEAITLLTRVVTDEANIKGKVKADYEDVADGAWYESYIGFLQKLGYLDNIEVNYGWNIAPNANITRGEFAELLYRIDILGNSDASLKIKSFSDVKNTHKYINAINFAVSAGIVNGYEDGTFRPENNITRAEVVTMVNRFLGRVPTGVAGTVSFSDTASHWANGQILAACNPEGVAWTAETEATPYAITGTSSADYIPALYEQSANLSADAIRDGVAVIAEQMKKDILNTPNTQDIYGDKMTAQIYYISEKNGNDANDGKTPETAWKTPAAIASNVRFPKAGTTFLFERGGIYRGQITSYQGAIYGSYGEGNKPLLLQSKKNFADPALWEKTEYPNVWKCTEQLINVGIIGFDHDLQDYSEATYNEVYGLIMNKDTRGFDGPHELCGDLQFYSDLPGKSTSTPGDLYVYSTAGNPGERFSSIEIGEKIDIFDGAPKNVIIDNLSLKFTGGHGIGFGTTANVTVTNCVFSWLGGSVLKLNDNGSAVNYGNAVEIYGGCDGYYVENNWMYQIYDTAVTHQRSASTGDCYQGHVRYTSNLMEYVYWGIEFYNAPPKPEQLGKNKDVYKRLTEDVVSAYNLLRLGGYGWGSITRYRGASLYCGSTLSENKDCSAIYNIYDRAYGNLLSLPSNATELQDKNIYIQTLGQPWGRLRGSTFTCDYNSANYINKTWGDENAVVIVIDPDKEPIVRNIPEGLAPATLA